MGGFDDICVGISLQILILVLAIVKASLREVEVAQNLDLISVVVAESAVLGFGVVDARDICQHVLLQILGSLLLPFLHLLLLDLVYQFASSVTEFVLFLDLALGQVTGGESKGVVEIGAAEEVGVGIEEAGLLAFV